MKMLGDLERIDPEEPKRNGKSAKFNVNDYERYELAEIIEALIIVGKRRNEPLYFTLMDISKKMGSGVSNRIRNFIGAD
jgi:hypothetical protein